MGKAVKWEAKNGSKGKKKRYIDETDYDIPRFGYKSSFIILVTTLLSLFIVPFICDVIQIDYRLPTVILCGATAGFSAAYTQFFIERDQGITKDFWIVGGLLSLFCAMLIFLVVYMGKIM
ncbi:MAG: hypothetical protein MR210_04435 [Erysipelotrichaceae bacterium]|nr:hypothetical protein [Erysipelotrichaceae bacterium]MDY5252611.1 hypothetical protein [Erysipelotrichaceae bacterium]